MTGPKIGYGQQSPNDTSGEYNALMFVIAQVLARVRTVVIVKVVAVGTGTVDVHPLVKQVDGIGNATPHGTIFGLPYLRLQGGKNAVIIDPAVDDIGIAAICDRDISAVKSTKAEATPGSLRRFDLADGIYLGGILNGDAEQTVTFTATGMKLADKNGNVIVMKPGSIAMTTTLLTVTGGIIAGFGGADQVGVQTHRHLLNNQPPIPGS